ncbi:MAG: diacylglycerol kinase family lipid kinase [Firmicutes bacterium]|nr:diacylglycerol kinase family lipid kinase [Bacillota bacterium]
MKASKKYFFIINPQANSGRVLKTWQQVEIFLKAQQAQYEAVFSRDAEHVSLLAGEASHGGYTVVGVGGDGTISRIATALKGSKTHFGIIPAGSGNDFARSFGLPKDPVEACRVILQGEFVEVDLGIFNGRGFCNILGAGLDAKVAADANRIFKKFSGKFGYVLALIRQLILYRPALLELEIDGQTHQVKGWLVSIANGKYLGGGMKIAPQADPGDGFFDVIIVNEMSVFRFLYLFPLVYSGKHIDLDVVQVWRGRRISIRSNVPLDVQADGEMAGTTPFTIEVAAKALSLLVPKAYKEAVKVSE